jgi:uncharacterized protein (DUF1330 family)
MPAYMIVSRESPVRDAAAFAEYGQRNRSNTAHFQTDFGLKPLSVYGRLEALEGSAPDGVVLLEFPSLEAARAWYDSPAYQDALGSRLRAADWRVTLVDGL